ncbi:HlyD family efflux transporter periplasmic adaptor subunit [Campylobacter sp. JMF_01 NE2]|uniref:HlyD family secretion protein n=1 Tax=unclassified Campylobacter TaxID=2593542 RepID=UPI0022E9A497|nr:MULTISPECIES: HlyD family efflux transporter periplasmic adaptor subunit [unclassified Campylobacter]MDA3053372.1 HlyD family efflux transporter periplasmic adaptor subunit [Campylobacter sp. JMF_03 NE3]MDA3067722.1 HlyD family efflux transporter periplasmic adaptor subunit [Campylobacter sp. JMF_01 NE2]
MKNFFLLIFFFSFANSQELLNGYIEAEFTYISPYNSGILDEIYVQKGQKISPADKLFCVDKGLGEANVKIAQNEVNKAKSNYENLIKGKRQSEISALNAQLNSAKIALENAQKEFFRAQKLFKSNTISKSEFDQKSANFDTAKAKVAEFEAVLQTANLGARDDEIEIAKTNIAIAEQNLEKTKLIFAKNTAVSQHSGQIYDIYFKKGEFVGANSPVLSILEPQNIKVRFFVPQKILAKLKIGDEIGVSCDGCEGEKPAVISYISPSAEFTPPVIYSVASREKMVFMLEATFAPNTEFKPGLGVSVRIK